MGEMTDKLKGKLNEVVGAAKGDRKQETKGKGQQAKGDVKGKTEDLKRGMKDDQGR